MAKKQEILYTPPNEGFWTISGVNYRGETETYRLFKKMTPAMTQDHLSEFYGQEKAKGNPRPMNSVLHFAIMNASYNLRNKNLKETERLRRFLQAGFQEYPHTLTSVIYSPSGEDRIVHNHRTPDEFYIDAHVVGPDGWMKEIKDKKILESLLGTQDVVQIDKVSQWINRTNSFIWRLNSKPEQKHERVAGFGAGNGRLCFLCGGVPFGEYPAFRVLRVD
ncbi:hypothetical protein ES703_59657 [subsurface metagenome]